MDEKTKELDLIEDLNLSETKEITKEINSLDDLKDIGNEEVTEEFNINDKEREEVFEKEPIEETDLGETKKVQTTNDVIENKTNKTNDIAYENNKKEEQQEKVKKDKVKNNKKKSKKPLIISIVVVVIIILIIVVLLFLNNNKNVDNRSKYYKAIENSLDSGKLSDTFDYVLKKLKVDATHAKLLAIDIDSDKSLDLVAYIENKNQNYILNFEVDDGVYYEENYEISEIKNFGYAYSYTDNNLYWFTLNNNEYTVISNGKKIMSKEEFEENYYIVTEKYEKKEILANSVDYDLDKELNIDLLEENKITKKKILSDNKLTEEKVKEIAESSKTAKENASIKEEEQKEEEKKKQQEEELKNVGYPIDKYILKYGKYMTLDGTSSFTINNDHTAIFKNAENEESCSWSGDMLESENGKVPVVTITCSNQTYSTNLTDKGLKDSYNDIEYEYQS